MSIESARKFLEKVNNETEFKEKLAIFTDKVERMKFINEAGFDFTKEELDSVMTELGDDELDQVAGGSWGCGFTHEAENESCCGSGGMN